MKINGFYTFVFAPTIKSPTRKFNVHHRVIYSMLVFAGVGLLTVVYGMYIIAQHAVVVAKLNLTQLENRRLREQNREATSSSISCRHAWPRSIRHNANWRRRVELVAPPRSPISTRGSARVAQMQ
jgi:hypothetical protein